MKIEAVVTQPLIEGARILLRPLRRSDEGLIAFYAGDRRVAEMTPSLLHPLPPGAAEALVGRAMAEDREEHVWAMDGSAVGQSEVLGLVTLRPVGGGQAEISYWVAPAFWNAGYASEAVQAIVAANPLGNTHLFASVFQGNPASARVLTNAGFVYLGDAEAHCVARGAMIPTWTYSRPL